MKKQVTAKSCTIVGIGASAGGIKALESFFKAFPKESDKAYIVVMHFSPDYPSHMPELLQQITSLQVLSIESGMNVSANRVYVIPPGKNLKLEGMKLTLIDVPVERGARITIDSFFESLAESAGKNAIGIIFSGSGSDGSHGLRYIKNLGGLTVVQSPETADYKDMPLNAIKLCSPDIILPPEEMFCALNRHPSRSRSNVENSEEQKSSAFKEAVVALVLKHTGHDFSNYKKSTIGRRIVRRVLFLNVRSHKDYLDLLVNSPAEARKLVADFLIGVTTFFRDAESYDALEKLLHTEVLNKSEPKQMVRIWVAGCSTGEEAYSIAILCKEVLKTLKNHVKIQIFATDLDATAIKIGRAGVYPLSISDHVSALRCAEFFSATDDGYQVKPEIREMVAFAVHDLVKDPPFLNMDLISCRNLFIYLEADLQKKVLPVFHRCLNKNGILFLGHSEGVGIESSYFSIINNTARLFRRNHLPEAKTKLISFIGLGKKVSQNSTPPKAADISSRNSDLSLAYMKKILEASVPPSLIVRSNGDIVFMQKQTEIFLHFKEDHPPLNLLNNSILKLRPSIRYCLKKAGESGGGIAQRNIRLEIAGKAREVSLKVKRVRGLKAKEVLFIVTLNSMTKKITPGLGGIKGQTIKSLSEALKETKLALREAKQELENIHGELQEVGEQSQSANEEMQSTNEELETTKEEFQSLNEELTTVNGELQLRIDEFTSTENDLTNLLASVDLGIIFLDLELRIRRFTPKMTKIIRILNIDLGRHITDIVSNVGDLNIAESVHEVLETLIRKEVEVKDKSGAWYLMRIVPYRTLANKIDGVVISFADISAQKAEQKPL